MPTKSRSRAMALIAAGAALGVPSMMPKLKEDAPPKEPDRFDLKRIAKAKEKRKRKQIKLMALQYTTDGEPK